jgi:hypothetical protein
MSHIHSNNVRETGVNNLITVKTDQQSLVIKQPDYQVVEVITAGPQGKMGKVDTGSLLITASVDMNTITFTKGDGSTFPITVDTGSSGAISYIDTTENDTVTPLRNLKIYDYDTVTSVNFNGTDQTLTLVLGTPNPPTANITITGFETDRFNKQTDSYIVTGQHSATVYNIQRIVLQDNSIATPLIDATGEDITNPVALTLSTTGSRTYTYTVFSRNPTTNQLVSDTKSITRDLNKSLPGNPVLSFTSNLTYFGLNDNKIEFGDFGTIPYSVAYGPANGWQPVTKYAQSDDGTQSPLTITPTGTSFTIQGTSVFRSPDNANDPDLQWTTISTQIFTRMRSLRAGYSSELLSYWTQNNGANLADLSLWQGNIYNTQDWVDPSGKRISFTFSGLKYLYIVMDSAYQLTAIKDTALGLNTILNWTMTTTANGYRIYVYNSAYQLGLQGVSTVSFDLE